MLIPSQVKIGGSVYTIEVVDHPVVLSNKQVLGKIEYDKCLITLDRAIQNPQVLFLTFLHELVHAFTHERMIEWSDKDEEYTDSLARALHAFFVDNKEALKEVLYGNTDT